MVIPALDSECLIVGGGIIGLSIARELRRRGMRDITIVDRGEVGREASWAAAGMLAPNIETDSSYDFRRFGLASLETYPTFAAELLDETGVDIELNRSGTLCIAFDERESAEITQTYDRQRARNVLVHRLEAGEVREIEPAVSPNTIGALFYPSDWQVDNRKLVTALRRYSELNGIRVVEGADVTRLISSGDRVVGAITSSGEIEAKRVVLATGAWTSLIKIGDLRAPFTVRPIRGQMISFDTGKRRIGRVIYSERGYVVPRADGRVLIGATVEDVGFDKNLTADGIESLRAAAIEIIPRLADFEIAEQWAGLRPFTADGLPIIGKMPGHENLFVATAHYRNGILLAPETAMIIADQIAGNEVSPYFEKFSPERFVDAAGAGGY